MINFYHSSVVISLVALRCTFSSRSISFFKYGRHACMQYSNFGLTNLLLSEHWRCSVSSLSQRSTSRIWRAAMRISIKKNYIRGKDAFSLHNVQLPVFDAIIQTDYALWRSCLWFINCLHQTFTFSLICLNVSGNYCTNFVCCTLPFLYFY